MIEIKARLYDIAEELIKTVRKIKALNEERRQLKNKLEVLND